MKTFNLNYNHIQNCIGFTLFVFGCMYSEAKDVFKITDDGEEKDKIRRRFDKLIRSFKKIVIAQECPLELLNNYDCLEIAENCSLMNTYEYYLSEVDENLSSRIVITIYDVEKQYGLNGYKQNILKYLNNLKNVEFNFIEK